MSDAFAGYRQEDFIFEEKRAGIVYPHANANGRWAIYTEYFGAFPSTALMLLERGYAIAYLENTTRWCAPEDPLRRVSLADYLEREKGFSHRCVPIGMSCGGLHAIRFAAVAPAPISMSSGCGPINRNLSYSSSAGCGSANFSASFVMLILRAHAFPAHRRCARTHPRRAYSAFCTARMTQT